MPRDNRFVRLSTRLVALPLRLRPTPPFRPPRKAIIIQPGFLSQVMLTTPLLTALTKAFPEAQFDWAVSAWARPAIATHPRLAHLLDTGRLGLPDRHWGDVGRFVRALRAEAYDTCFIPNRSALLALSAWQAGIPQRVGLNVDGRGALNNYPVSPPEGEKHEAMWYLELARSLELSTAGAQMSFFPPDADRTAITAMLVDELEWLGAQPLVILHPGGGDNPLKPDPRKRWPAARFALLGNYLGREHKAKVLIVGAEQDAELAKAIMGLMSAPAVNWAGRLSLSRLGALCEMANLYVGNDTGPTHVAAAVGCPTLAIFGPSAVAISRPFMQGGKVMAMPALPDGDFSWSDNLVIDDIIAAADSLLRSHTQPAPPLTDDILSDTLISESDLASVDEDQS